MTVPIFKLSNQIEPFYLQYSSHTDGYNSRYVDTTAILRTDSYESSNIDSPMPKLIECFAQQTELMMSNEGMSL